MDKERASGKENVVASLVERMQSQNLAADLSEQQLGDIASRVVAEYEIDKESRSEWLDRIKAAMDLAMLVSEEKNYPFQNAANVKFPLLTVAALQFNARAYPAIIKDNQVAKCQTWGRDPNGAKAARARRVSEHLSYQLLSGIPEWEGDTDKMLLILPIVGSCFRKVYYDPALKRMCSRLVTAERFVVNYYTRDLATAPRATEEMDLYPFEIEERIRSGRYVDFTYEGMAGGDKEEGGDEDRDAAHLFLEQHRLIDLDDDGYPEPYVVTVHHGTQKVVRVVANWTQDGIHEEGGKLTAIRKQDYYVPYQFLPSPDGGFYGWGFGWLLKDINETTNTTINQMLDAGHLTNVQGGLVSAAAGIKEKSIRLKMGEWRVVNTTGPLSQAVLPITYPGPSAVLFNLLGLLVDMGKELASIKDVLSGDTPTTAPVGTTMAMIEQGLQVFTSIYKRIHRSLKTELGLYAQWNRRTLSPEKYSAFHDEPADPMADYAPEDMDILPVSDPNTVSKAQNIAKAMFLMEVSDNDIASGMPILDRMAVYQRVFEAAQIEEGEKLIAPPPQPNPEEEVLKRIVAMLAVKDQEAEILKKHTDALKNVATAEAAEEGTQLQAIQAYLGFLQAQIEAKAANGQGGVPGVEGQPGNAMGAGQAAQPGLGGGGAAMPGALPVNGPVDAGMGIAPVASGL
jgi:chaperonin GroES